MPKFNFFFEAENFFKLDNFSVLSNFYGPGYDFPEPAENLRDYFNEEKSLRLVSFLKLLGPLLKFLTKVLVGCVSLKLFFFLKF